MQTGTRSQDEELQEISWDEFFEEFGQKDSTFVYPEDGSNADKIGRLEKRSET